MRILIVTNMYPTAEAPHLGIFVRQQELSLRKLGIEVDVANLVDRSARGGYLRGLVELTGRLRRERYDLLHSHHTYSTVPALIARMLACKFAARKIPIVETFHEGEVFHRGANYQRGLMRRIRYSSLLKAWALRRVDFAIPVQKDMLLAVLGERAAKIPSRVIPAGIDLEQFKPEDPRRARQRLGWDPDGCYVFFPCDPGKPEKRYDLARAGFELFARDHPGARLIVGGGIPYEKMPDTIKAADVILNPTDFEASPTIVKEALACERPVVSTDTGDVRECYGDLPGVFICDWSAAGIAGKLRQAVCVPTPYGGQERMRALGLDVDQVARRLIEVYQEILGHKK